MSAFPVRDGVLHAEDVSLETLAADIGTPFYCYSTQSITRAYADFTHALRDLPATVCYALKANGALAVVRTLARLGAGADVVSEGELRRALKAGVPANKIVFAGVGKTEPEMAFGLETGILQFNVESLPELETLARVAVERGTRAPVSIRVNPDVDARTHEKISTGMAENKFGIDLAQIHAAVTRAMELPGIAMEGLAVHIGSQLTDVSPFGTAFARIAALYGELKAAGIPLRRLDLGGGLGIPYSGEAAPDIRTYARLAREATAALDADLIFEPGRYLVGNAGILVTRVVYIKDGAARRFVIVDAAMNDLIRPSLYDAWHEIVPVRAAPPTADRTPVDIVGPICETADTFARQRPMPPLAAGDLLAICSTGAYGAVMASTYNGRLPAPEVMVNGACHAVIRPRPAHDALMAQERYPAWLNTGSDTSERADATRGVA